MYYMDMRHYTKYRSSSSLSMSMEDQLITSGDVIGGVVTRANHLYYQNVDFGADNNDKGFL